MIRSEPNELLLRALRRQPVPRTPVWIMRQAGRYLPEYRATRARAGSFVNLMRNPELACEVTMQPLARFRLDAAILFSDILTIPDAMGLGLSFEEGEGPRFARRIESVADIRALPVPDPEQDLRYVMDAVRVIRKELIGHLPLIGFSGSPWTLAAYMVEGRGSKDFAQAKALLIDEPQSADLLLERLSAAVGLYLEAQAMAGAQVLMIFDTWGGLLWPAAFRRYSLSPMQRVVEHLRSRPLLADVPIVLFTKGAGAHLQALATCGADALGVDWTCDLARARELAGAGVALQGNLDPAALYARPERLLAAVDQVLASFGPGPGHVFNLGHGITPGVDPMQLDRLVERVHEVSPRYAQAERAAH